MSEPTVVVLGGGVGGVVAANELHARLKDRANIIVVERNPQQSFPPSYLWVMTGERQPDAISRDITRLERKSIEVVAGDVDSIDVNVKNVNVGGREIAYDYLIVALGAALDFDSIPGLQDAHTYYTLEGSLALQREIAGLKNGRVAISVAGTPYQCPAAPYEGGMLLEGFFHARHIRHNIDLAIYTPEPAPMPIAGKEAGEAVQEMLAHKGIRFHGDKELKAVKKGEMQFGDGSSAEFDMLITIPPHKAPGVVVDAGLTEKDGWIAADPLSLETKNEGVFAIGDIASIPLYDGMKLPKAGVFAHGQAEVVARNIASRILGHTKREEYDGSGYCFLEAGGGVAGMAQGDFYGEPRHITLRTPSPVWHWGKVAFERYWLWKWY